MKIKRNNVTLVCKDKRETQIDVAVVQGAEGHVWNSEREV